MTRSPLLSVLSGGLFLLLATGASAQDWTGAYVGGHVGYGLQSDKSSENLVFDTDQDGDFDDQVTTVLGANAFSPGFCGGKANANNAAAGCKKDKDGGVDVGARIGYDWQVGGMVVGGLAELSYADIKDSVTGFSTTPAAYTFKRKMETMVAVRARVGLPTEKYLFYGTAGIARADVNRSFTTTNTANSFTPWNGSRVDGYQIGVGVERKGSGRLVYGLEYLYTSLNDKKYTVLAGPGSAAPTNPFLQADPTGTNIRRGSDDINLHSVRFTISYRLQS